MIERKLEIIRRIAEEFKYPEVFAAKFYEVAMRHRLSRLDVEETLEIMFSKSEIAKIWRKMIEDNAEREVDWKSILRSSDDVALLLKEHFDLLSNAVISAFHFEIKREKCYLKPLGNGKYEYVIVAPKKWEMEGNAVRVMTEKEFNSLPDRKNYIRMFSDFSYLEF